MNSITRSLAAEQWDNVAFWIQVALWILGFAVFALGVAAYWAKSNSSLLKQEKSAQQETIREAEATALKAQLTEADKKVAELERLRAPRRLNEAQKAKLSTFLTGKPKGEFTIKASAAADDARAYGDEIAAFFRDRLGWTVKVDNAMIMGQDVSGMWVTIKDGNAIPAITSVLHPALEYAELPVRHAVSVDPGLTTQTEVWLSIGSKK